MATAAGRKTVSYIVKCALAAGDTLVKGSYTFAGKLGLAPEWKHGSCGTSCQQIVSACVMAHVNTTGRRIPDLHPRRRVRWCSAWDAETNKYPMQEGAFFGNIFTSPPQAYFCNGYDWDRGPVAGRIGADDGRHDLPQPLQRRRPVQRLLQLRH